MTTVSETAPPPSTSTFTSQARPTSVTQSTTAVVLPGTHLLRRRPRRPITDRPNAAPADHRAAGRLHGHRLEQRLSVPAFFPTPPPYPVLRLLRNSLIPTPAMRRPVQGSGRGPLLHQWRHEPDGGRAGVGAVLRHHDRGQRRAAHGTTVRVQFLSLPTFDISVPGPRRGKTRWEKKGR